MSKRAKINKTLFFERIDFKLIRNFMHQVKSARDSIIPLKRAIEIFRYPEYIIRLQKERQIPEKMKNLHKKNCTKNFARNWCPSQLNIKLFTKNKNNFRLRFLQMTTFVDQMTPIIVKIWKENKKPTKSANMQLSRIFYENWLYQEQRPYEGKKLLWREIRSSLDKGCDLIIEMLSYKLTEIRLANLNNQFSFLKNKYFHNS